MTEFEGVELGDKRRSARLVQLAVQLSEQPGASIPDATGDWGQTCAAYRFLANVDINPAQLLRTHWQRTIERSKTVPVILAVSDTTSFNYAARPGTRGLGPIRTRRTKTYGLWQHTVMAFSTAGNPLGLLEAQWWARDPAQFGSRHRRKQTPIEQKETYKWLQGFRAVQRAAEQTPDCQWVSVSDRESDLYELFALALDNPNGPAVLVRAHHDRNLVNDTERRLFAHVASRAVVGETQVQVPRRAQLPRRTARLTVRACEVCLAAPESKGKKPALRLWAIEAREMHPPKGVSAIHWRLLTTLPVTTFQSAVEKLGWYCVRWQIEVFHRVLKSGCQVEAVQLQEATRLKRLLAIEVVIAWRVMWLMKEGREQPQRSLNEILEEGEWRALVAYVYQRGDHRGETPPDSVPTLGEGMRWIGRLGGHLGRKGDGPPGPKSLAKGLQRLHDLYLGWQLAHEGKKCA